MKDKERFISIDDSGESIFTFDEADMIIDTKTNIVYGANNIPDLVKILNSQSSQWQKLKEWLKNQITDLRHIEIKTKTQSLRVNDAVNCFRQVLGQMQELEKNKLLEIDQLKQENETLFLQLSKQEIDEHKPVYCTLAGNDCKYLGKIKELKYQLEEKDKEIERLKNLFKLNNEVVINQGKEIFDLRVRVLQQKQNQTQLAIQELSEVERLLYESHYKEIDGKYYAEYEDINNLIDSRIKALEELKEG